jgi:hypothetical protein
MLIVAMAQLPGAGNALIVMRRHCGPGQRMT